MKRLYKSRKNRIVSGVCGGIAEYFNIDPVIVRIVFIIFFFIGFSAILAYILGVIIIPNQPTEIGKIEESTPASKSEEKSVKKPTPVSASNSSLIIGIILVVIGAFFVMDRIPFFSDYYWWMRHNLRHFLVPGVFIIIGVLLLVKGTKKE